MLGRRARGRRLPEQIARCLPFAPRERPLAWATCRDGCHLVATVHGLWEWPLGRAPVRHCWRAIEELQCRPTEIAVVGGPADGARCRHRIEPGSGLDAAVRTMDAASRPVQLAYRLPSGTRVQVLARSCRYDGSFTWNTRLVAAPGAEAASDSAHARALLERVRGEYDPGFPRRGPDPGTSSRTATETSPGSDGPHPWR